MFFGVSTITLARRIKSSLELVPVGSASVHLLSTSDDLGLLLQIPGLLVASNAGSLDLRIVLLGVS